MRSRIQEYNFVTRKRIRYRFCKFVQQFGECKVAVGGLRLKYLMSLEALLPSLYSERFQVTDRQGRRVDVVVTGNGGLQRSKGTEEGAEEVRGRAGPTRQPLPPPRRLLRLPLSSCRRSCRPSATSRR